jgi:four helix bundle protein
MKENLIKEKSFKFAVRIVKLHQFLAETQRAYVLSKQLLKSGTAVGALVREAEHAESTADFIHKMAIAQKEINESIYWLELLKQTQYLNEEQFQSLHTDAIEIIKILTTLIKSTKAKLNPR